MMASMNPTGWKTWHVTSIAMNIVIATGVEEKYVHDIVSYVYYCRLGNFCCYDVLRSCMQRKLDYAKSEIFYRRKYPDLRYIISPENLVIWQSALQLIILLL